MTEQYTLALAPTQPAPASPAEQRDAALDALEAFRGNAVDLARAAADELHAANGRVTATEVLRLLRDRGHGPLLDSVDRRFMGCVFRRGWSRVGWERTGSHKRAVPVWARKARPTAVLDASRTEAVTRILQRVLVATSATTVLEAEPALLTIRVDVRAALLLLGATL